MTKRKSESQIVAVLKESEAGLSVQEICRKYAIGQSTFYKWRDKANGGFLWLHLRQSSKRRRKRYKVSDSRGRLAEKRYISERPANVESRKYKSHGEIDSVHGRGSSHCIVTLLARKTGYVMTGKLPDKSTDH